MLLVIVNEGFSISDEHLCLLIPYQRKQSSHIVVQVVCNRHFIIPQSPRSARRNRPKLACGLATEPLDGGASGRFVRAGVLALPGLLPVIQTRQVARAVCDLRSSLSTNSPLNFPSLIHFTYPNSLFNLTSTSNSYLHLPNKTHSHNTVNMVKAGAGFPQHSH